MRRGGVDFLVQLQALGLPAPVPEFRFAPPRRWAFDFAFLADKIAIECEGGTWIPGGGRHTRGVGFARDCQKYGEAFARGWTVLRATPAMFNDGTVATWLERRMTAPAAIRAQMGPQAPAGSLVDLVITTQRMANTLAAELTSVARLPREGDGTARR